MRIGMMADVYKPHVSGITNYIYLNKRYLEAAGHQVYVFTFGDEGFEDDEANIIRSPGLPLLDTGYYVNVQHNRRVRHLIRLMDVIHVHHPFLSGTLALRYCRPRGIPVLFTNHTRYDLYTQIYLPAVPDALGETALQAYLPAFCRNCDIVISPSPGMRKVLLSFGVDSPIEVVPNGVELESFRRPSDCKNRAEFGLTPDDVVLIYTGRLGPEKNLAFLLQSFSGAAQVYDHLALMLVGDGLERENLQSQAARSGVSDRVHFTGFVPYSSLPAYLAMADAFVTASVTEVHPLSVIEAMAAGLPVLGIQSPGVGDTVVDGETGFLAPSADQAGFTARLVRLGTDHDQRWRMGQAARQAANAYDINRTIQMLLNCYRKARLKSASRQRSLRVRLTRLLDQLRL